MKENEKDLPVAKPIKEITDFSPAREEMYFFHLRDSEHEFVMGLKEILQCVRFAEDEGIIPKAPDEWWTFLYGTYDVHYENQSPNFKEGYYNGFWNAMELIVKSQKKDVTMQKIQEKYIHMNRDELFCAVDEDLDTE